MGLMVIVLLGVEGRSWLVDGCFVYFMVFLFGDAPIYGAVVLYSLLLVFVRLEQGSSF